MTIPYADAIKKPASKKIVFAKQTHRKHFYAWTLSGTAGIWYQATGELVELVTENDVQAVQVASFAALIALDVSVVGGWFYDEATERLNYKAVTATTAFQNFAVGTIVFRFSQFPEEDDSGRPHDPRITSVPSLDLRVSQIFESKAAQVGSGSMGLESVDGLFSRLDFEPDGEVELVEVIQ